QIQEDLKKLKTFSNDSKILHKWLNSRHYRKELQVRIRPDHFLLNNILLLQGLSFEDLFDKEKLPGQADMANIEQKDTDKSDEEEKAKLDNELLSQIDDKLDKVLEKLNKGKTYRSFRQCFFNLIEYRLNLQIFIDYFYLPKENGFSFYKENPEMKLSTKEVYAWSYIILQTHISKIHTNHHIGKYIRELLAKMNTMINNDFILGRLLNHLFILSIFLYLINKLVSLGINTKRPIFQILEADIFTDYYKLSDFDNKIVREKTKEAFEKTNNLIEYIQDSNLTLDEDYCVKCEIMLANFFSRIELLFNKLMPILNRWGDIINTVNSRKEIDKAVNGLLNIGRSLTFWIEPKQLDCFDEYIKEIEEFQIGLGKYYDANMDESTIVARTIEDRHDST
ncbi:MAG: hypothetical protein LBE13_00265, partial [Bacteroidales bacterium]|nr:hypothetical protein [Bacteroidales bacterium]